LIYNLLDTFKKAYEIKGDDLVIENHKLKEGLYIKIKSDQTMESVIITKDSVEDEIYEWFRKADFYSCIINTNKAVKDKKIHSNNYLTLFIKKKIFYGDEKDTLPKEILLEKIEEYFKVLYDDKYNNESIDKDLGEKLDQEKFEYCKKFILEKIDLIYDAIIEMNKEFDNYVKIYFDFNDWKSYELEFNRYLYPNVFNSSNYNVLVENELYGLSNMNMGLNSKKPYLEHKTLKCKVPFLIEVKDALILYKYGMWLQSNKLGPNFKAFDYDYKIPLKDYKRSETDVYYMNLKNKNGEIEFGDFDIIPGFEEKIEFEIYNHIEGSYYDMNMKERVSPVYDDARYNGKRRECFLNALNDFLYNKRLSQSFRVDFKDIKPPKWGNKKVCNILIMSRDAVFNYVYKDDVNGLKAFVKKYYLDLVVEQIKIGRIKGIDALNTYIAIKKLFELGGEKIVKKIKELRSEIEAFIKDQEKHDLLDKYQYSFLAGQISYYLMDQSKAASKNHDVIERICNYKNVSRVNDELRFWFKRYGHAVPLRSRKFNKAFSMVLGFNKSETIDEDIFLAGYLGDNIFYKGEEK
jgi:CRISPR-associated protein Csh1